MIHPYATIFMYHNIKYCKLPIYLSRYTSNGSFSCIVTHAINILNRENLIRKEKDKRRATEDG